MNTLNVVESVFFAALEKNTPEARAAFLDEACHADANLRRCVERLLNAHPKAEGFLQAPAPDDCATIDVPPLVEKPGTVIGPYKLLQQLGEGGFGVVFLAEQEHPVRRKLALKIIKPGMDSKQVVARFEAERQALAMMDHPNIARVFDVGTTDNGRPYFVMELVKGVPITEFCDHNRLTPRERLELFVPVCQAVQHAHQKSVIHRDLKPSNVLVAMYDDKPVPKVIDFGVAKAIEQKLTEQTLFTRVGQVIGTLEYMSPEQASLNALDVDTRSDVYALGVLLYELLTGTPPLNKERLHGVAFMEVLRLVREEEPPRPSTRLTQPNSGLPLLAAYRKSDAQKLPKLMRGELDWIAMKALEKDRSRRYATANALAADVQRYLKDEQVEACPPSVGYRLQKYARKHKTAVGMVSIAAALMLFGIVATSWQAVRATRAEGQALEERDDALKARQAEAEQRSMAVAAQAKAQRERDAANAEREKVRRLHYTAALNLIPTVWEADNIDRVMEMLDEQRPKAGEEDLRGFEWHYWDNLCHAELRTLKLDEGAGNGPVFSGDGTRVVYICRRKHAAADEDEAFIKVRDIGADREIGSWKITFPRRSGVNLQLNRNGTRLAVTSKPLPGSVKWQKSGGVVVWDVATGKELWRHSTAAFPFFFGPARQVAISPDGKLLAVVEREAPRKGDEPKKEPAGRSPAEMAMDSPQSVKIWHLADLSREPTTVEPASGLINLEFSSDGSRLAGLLRHGTAGVTAQLWDTATGKRLAHVTVSDFWAQGPGFAFSADGTRVAALSGSIKPQIFLWDCASGLELKLLRSMPISTTARLRHLVLSLDGRRIVAWDDIGRVLHVLDTDTGEYQTLRSRMPIFSAAFSADGTRVLTSGFQNVTAKEASLQVSGSAVQEWAIQPSKVAAEDRGPLPDRKLHAEIKIWSPDGSRQAAYSFPSTTLVVKMGDVTEIRILDRAGKQIRVFSDQLAVFKSMVFSPDGRLVFSRAENGEVKICETDSGQVRWAANLATLYQAKNVGVPRPPADDICAFSRDGQLVAVPSPEGVKIVSTADF